MPEDGPGPQQREEIRRAARATRAEARRVRDATGGMLRQSLRAAELAASGDTGGSPGGAAFAALPVPAALIDGHGRVVTVNPAWRALTVVSGSIGVGADFGAGWTAVSGDAFIEDAVAAVLRTSKPMQAESTVRGGPPLRLLVQIGPAAMRDGPGALVVLVDITGHYERERQLLFDATHDPLTEVANRAWLLHAIREALDRLRRYREPFALVYLDLDGFKPLNDRYGHAAGDIVLREAATRWSRIVRRPDLLARVGGDEFVVLIWHAPSLDNAGSLADRLTHALREPFTINGTCVTLTVTVGVAAPPVGISPDDALALADQEMYRHKRPLRA